MNKKNYTIENVSRHLNKLPGIKISNTTIKIAKNAQIGLKNWANIDFLRSNGFNLVWTNNIEEHERNKEESKEKIKEKLKSKKVKHKFTINTVDSIKKIIKDINIKNNK